MNGHKSGCMLCGAPLVYSKTPRALACAVCGGIFQTDAACAQGHFVCDACHAASAADVIARVCLHADERNPARRTWNPVSLKLYGAQAVFRAAAAALWAAAARLWARVHTGASPAAQRR